MSFLLGIVFGIGWTTTLSELPGYLICGLLFLSAVLLAGFSFFPLVKRFSLYADKAIRLIAGICFGMAWASILCGTTLDESLPKHLEKRKIRACNDFCGHLSEIGRNPFSKFNAEPVQS